METYLFMIKYVLQRVANKICILCNETNVLNAETVDRNTLACNVANDSVTKAFQPPCSSSCLADTAFASPFSLDMPSSSHPFFCLDKNSSNRLK